MGHQTGRVKPAERKKFLNWLMEMEYKVHKLPKEDLVIFLHVPTEMGLKLIRKKAKRKYTGKKKRDICEDDLEYLKNSEKMYLYLAKKFPHWVKIDCLGQKNRLLSPKKIHQKILTVLCKKDIIPGQRSKWYNKEELVF